MFDDETRSSWLHPRAILRKFINRLVFLLNSIVLQENFYSGIVLRTINNLSRTIVTALCRDYFRSYIHSTSRFFAIRVSIGKRIVVLSLVGKNSI